MKGTLLQIGDIVAWGDKICRVEQVNNTGKVKISYLDGRNFIYLFVDAIILNPVPLTEEVLKKNLEWHMNHDMESWWEINGVRIPKEYVKNVHELQHLFRMFGLDEQADRMRV